MNNNSGGSDFNAAIDSLIDQACREFEKMFAENPEFRIEDFKPRAADYLAAGPPSHTPGQILAALIGELIFVEMELRINACQAVDLAEYRLRFPEFAPAIQRSFERLKKLREQQAGRATSEFVKPPKSEDDLTSMDDFQVVVDSRAKFEPPNYWGPYHQITILKQGGFGVVCRAENLRTGELVAIKFPRPDRVLTGEQYQLFEAEAKKSIHLDHPGIVRIVGVDTHHQLPGIVMQLIDGEDLANSPSRPRGHQQIAEFVLKIAETLTYAHQHGVFHRDLKPGNILIDRHGHPLIADFGLALLEQDQLAAPRQFCGTKYYMSPEQVSANTQRIDGRSDLWSLGVILYELLTGRRPFDGLNDNDIYDQIEQRDPRPPRQIDPSIPQELQRICVKCLERQQRDRYGSADELAEDLRHFIKGPGDSHTEARKEFIPRGLRSFTKDDSDFFLDLLPGQRNRDGIPESIRFWQMRIKPKLQSDGEMPVGVLFGPSGSGKSSFVKAGLLPNLDNSVAEIYIEATQRDTEVRLLKELRRRIPELPADLALPTILHRMSKGDWLPEGKTKWFIVFDQFEQRLSRSDDFESAQLVKALRYCNGDQLQCLLLVRDDFMMGLSRFMDALELDFREGENAQAIDLFDTKHARKILVKIGQAFENLPKDEGELIPAQQEFIDKAIEQLAIDGQIICVHLTLFAEMFRHRPWTAEELSEVGGVAGTGEKFLEFAFGPSARDKRLRLNREASQKILEALLPGGSSDIRGAMRTESELQAASGLANAPQVFHELIKALDTQLKLITRADPNVSIGEEGYSAQSVTGGAWYQLTHDYLVPSIRSWLDQSLGMTRQGRAKLRIRSLSLLVEPNQTPKYLPTNLEWLAWRFLVPSKELTEKENLVMQVAGRRFGRQALLATGVLLIFALASLGLWRQIQHQQLVNSVKQTIDNLMNQDVELAPDHVRELTKYPRLAEAHLQKKIADPERTFRQQFRLMMGLLPFESSMFRTLEESVVSEDATPEDVRAVVTVLSEHQPSLIPDFSSFFDDVALNPRQRLRALSADILYCRGEGDWSAQAGLIATALPQESVNFVDAWLSNLSLARDDFREQMIEVFSDVEVPAQAKVLALAITRFHEQPAELIDVFEVLLRDASEARYDAILTTVEDLGLADAFASRLDSSLPHTKQCRDDVDAQLKQARQKKADIENEIKNILENQENGPPDPSKVKELRDNLASISATCNALGKELNEQRFLVAEQALALFRLGHPETLLEIFAGGVSDPQAIVAITSTTQERVRLFQLRQLYEQQGLAEFDRLHLRRSVLQSLAIQAKETYDEVLRRWLGRVAYHHVISDPDSCCFSTSELILRRLNIGDQAAWRSARRDASEGGLLGNVFIDKLGLSFSVFEEDRPGYPPRKFGIATNELSNGEIADFLRLREHEQLINANPNLPFNIVEFEHFKMIMNFCNWLTENNGLPADSCCYRSKVDFQNLETLLAKPNGGYRLPNKSEWLSAFESMKSLESLRNRTGPCVLDYAWLRDNAMGEAIEIALKLPSAEGLFDIVGNNQEIFEDKETFPEPFFEGGSSILYHSSTALAQQPKQHQIFAPKKYRLAVRLVWPIF
ncbi:MAG: protein kinase [Pirellulaceae bacterium]|nr:protein kinase [Pirellulaceae bacterium]